MYIYIILGILHVSLDRQLCKYAKFPVFECILNNNNSYIKRIKHFKTIYFTCSILTYRNLKPIKLIKIVNNKISTTAMNCEGKQTNVRKNTLFEGVRFRVFYLPSNYFINNRL